METILGFTLEAKFVSSMHLIQVHLLVIVSCSVENMASHLLTEYIIHIMSEPSQFCFRESPDVSRDEVEGNIRTRRKTKLSGFPRVLTLSVLLYF